MKAKHLHPAALLYFGYHSLKEGLVWLFAILAFNFSDKLTRWALWLGLAVSVLLVGSAILKYLCFRYEINEREVVLYSGIIFRRQTHIAYEKIQTLQTRQWFYLRPFGLLSLQIETSGHSSDEAEAILPVVSHQVLAEIRAHRDAAKNGVPEPLAKSAEELTEKQAGEAHYRIKARDLNLYALTSLGVVPLLIGIWVIYDRVTEVLPQKYVDSTAATLAHQSVLFLLGLAVFLLAFSLLVSYLMVVNRYFHFEVRQEKQQVITSKGFLQQNNVTASLAKIQAVVCSQSFLRQSLRLATVQLVIASKAADEEKDDNLVLLPVLNQGQALSRAHEFIDWLPPTTQGLELVDGRGRWRILRNSLLPTAIAAAACSTFWWPYGAWSLAVLPLAAWIGYYAGANTGVGLASNDVLLAQKGHLLTRKLYLIPKAKVQSMSQKQTPWMKKAGLSHLIIRVRAGNRAERVEARYLPMDKVSGIYEWYKRGAEQ